MAIAGGFMDGYLTLRDAAGQYDVKYDRLRRAAYDGRLLVVKREMYTYVRPEEVERFIREGGHAPTIAYQPRREGAASARVIAIAIPKGGTGKTTTTLNLGAALAEQGQRVLVVDADPQGSLTHAMGFNTNALEWTLQHAIEHYLKEITPELGRARLSGGDGIDLIPANALLNKSHTELLSWGAPTMVLKRLIDPLRGDYDFILIDTLPYLGVLVQNALVAADEVLIPLEPASLSSHSVKVMLEQISVIRRSEMNAHLRILGFLITRFDPKQAVMREFVPYARRTFGEEAPVFETMIEERPQMLESVSGSQRGSLLRYAPTDPAAQAYRQLASEVLHGTA
jgi:chromosome partitioning protein